MRNVGVLKKKKSSFHQEMRAQCRSEDVKFGGNKPREYLFLLLVSIQKGGQKAQLKCQSH